MALVVSVLPCLSLNSAIILHQPSLSAQLPLDSFSLCFFLSHTAPQDRRYSESLAAPVPPQDRVLPLVISQGKRAGVSNERAQGRKPCKVQ